jgi:glucose-6-phosphate isomerase
MSDLKNLFNNISFDKDLNLPSDINDINNNIKKILLNLSALSIVKNKELLDYTILEVSKFSQNKKDFLVFGTGGSNLGGKALINILQGNEKVKIHFFDNIDPINFENRIKKINLDTAGFIIISKSGSTPETISQYCSLIEIFDQRNCIANLYKNSLIISEDKISPLTKIAKQNNCKFLSHEKDIGGRFSIFSNVGMVPAILAGLDVKRIHEGAISSIKQISNNNFLKIAQFFRFQILNSNITSNVVMTYSDQLYSFGKWYLQLWAESIGKNNRGITPMHAIGTTDQHSQLQLYLDGPKDKFFTFITTDHSSKGLQLHNQTLKNIEIKFLENKKMGDLMQAEQKATVDTFRKNNFPFREIYIDEINEFTVGKLMASSIMETIATCIYFNVDPFNQPAVEQGKILTKKYLL